MSQARGNVDVVYTCCKVICELWTPGVVGGSKIDVHQLVQGPKKLLAFKIARSIRILAKLAKSDSDRILMVATRTNWPNTAR